MLLLRVKEEGDEEDIEDDEEELKVAWAKDIGC